MLFSDMFKNRHQIFKKILEIRNKKYKLKAIRIIKSNKKNKLKKKHIIKVIFCKKKYSKDDIVYHVHNKLFN